MVHNNSLQPVHLNEGQVLGCLQAAMVVPMSDAQEELPPLQEGVVRALDPTDPSPNEAELERTRRLLHVLNLEGSALTRGQQEQLKDLLLESPDLFALDLSELGSTDVVQHTIDTGNSKPIHQQARRMPFALRPKVEEITRDMLDLGVIRPSRSPWASPIVLVAKKHGIAASTLSPR